MGRRYVVISLFLLSACSASKFTASKNDTLEKSSVFGASSAESSDDSSGVIRQPSSGGSGSTSGSGSTGSTGSGSSSTWSAVVSLLGQLGSVPAQPLDPSIGSNEVYVSLMCSDSQSSSHTNFKKAVASNLPITLKLGDSVCTTNAATIKGLIVKDRITRDDLKAICPNALPPEGTNLGLKLVVSEYTNAQYAQNISILYARNENMSDRSQAADSNCDSKASPLVIHTASDISRPMPIALSSQAEGVNFDLLGAKNNHAPVRISWFTNAEYRMLVLPNKNGEVRGIDELFGDNTVGPDNQFASNGYAALAKYDLNHDGYIDIKDPVFTDLRLWLDANRDGIGQANEMVSLSEMGITFIDLDYSTQYSEMDQYGNQTTMKSVVGYQDGSLDLIFDLWFSYRKGGL